MLPLFNSREERYRSPFGAQPAGQAVFFRICLPRKLHCTGARFCIRYIKPMLDSNIEKKLAYAMFWAGMEGDQHEWWDCHYTPQQPAIYQYWFELDTGFGSWTLARQKDGLAELVQSKDAPKWQLTCYDPNFTTPDWLVGGIMYQIFPDRFACSGQKKQHIPTDRVIRDDWGALPEWRPTKEGKVLNNDYFCGDLHGIEQRLDRLAELGVTCLYLNPIFEAHSNHRYNTADYSHIDPLLGTEDDFHSLINTAKNVGIRVLLDGVFSHTGADSVYFNKNGRYSGAGAAQSLESPYYSWYHFNHWPDQYDSWWGFKTLPEVNETDTGFMQYINGADGVVRSRIRDGAAGWRLDVADELPDSFLDALRIAVKTECPDALVLGEVWEDASNKESYGCLRRYLLGKQLDSVMNYPFRSAIIKFLRGGDGTDFINSVMDVVENYPPQVTRLLMNPIGTHDTERILTALAGEPIKDRDREWQSKQKLSPQARKRGLRLMHLASALQYTLPGIPCIYYGDETGMEGYRDPFNRGCYPWGKEDAGLLHWYHRLGQLRHACQALREGNFIPLYSGNRVVCFERQGNNVRLLCAVNSSNTEIEIRLSDEWSGCTVCMGGGRIEGETLFIPALDCGLVTNSNMVTHYR